MKHNDFAQMQALRRKHLPNEPDDPDNLARAIWLEQQYWENMAIAVANGVGMAFAH